MRKASKTLLLIGGILGIFLFVGFLAAAIAFGVVAGLLNAIIYHGASLNPDIINVLNDLLKYFNVANYQALYPVMINYAIYCAVAFVFGIASVVLCFVTKAKERPNLVLLIFTMIVSFGACNPVAIAGGVVGVVNYAVVDSKEEAKEEANNQKEVLPEPEEAKKEEAPKEETKEEVPVEEEKPKE